MSPPSAERTLIIQYRVSFIFPRTLALSVETVAYTVA
jgi:hypothetical protein